MNNIPAKDMEQAKTRYWWKRAMDAESREAAAQRKIRALEAQVRDLWSRACDLSEELEKVGTYEDDAGGYENMMANEAIRRAGPMFHP